MYTRRIMAASPVYVGLRTASTCSQVGKTTWSPYGLSRSVKSLPDVLVTIRGLPRWLSTRGAAMRRPTGLEVLETIANCYSGISMLACCTVPRVSRQGREAVYRHRRCHYFDNGLRVRASSTAYDPTPTEQAHRVSHQKLLTNPNFSIMQLNPGLGRLNCHR